MVKVPKNQTPPPAPLRSKKLDCNDFISRGCVQTSTLQNHVKTVFIKVHISVTYYWLKAIELHQVLPQVTTTTQNQNEKLNVEGSFTSRSMFLERRKTNATSKRFLTTTNSFGKPANGYPAAI